MDSTLHPPSLWKEGHNDSTIPSLPVLIPPLVELKRID